jgi:hypothetical protein
MVVLAVAARRGFILCGIEEKCHGNFSGMLVYFRRMYNVHDAGGVTDLFILSLSLSTYCEISKQLEESSAGN